MRDLGDFLAEGGAVVGGGAALGGTLFFIAGSRPRFRPETIRCLGAPWGAFGGVFGLVVLISGDEFRA